ncbi:MAG: type II toxin-antitoxin system Phd/YefM family antitoxin [Pseudomonadota bacterium]
MTQIYKASDAKNRFGQVIDDAQAAPVRIQKNGRDVAVVISAEEFRRMIEATETSSVSPAIKALHEKSTKRWSKVYTALAQ